MLGTLHYINFLLLLIAVLSKVDEDEIISLPGYNGKFPSRQYSGYLTTGNGDKHLHYWLVESESKPDKDPLVLWFNGGPGCSSLDGFFYEHGPFEIQADARTIHLREHRWNRIANILYIESPAGVGFSYSDTLNYKHNDESTAKDNYDALIDFFQKFPEYKSHKLYITGESYAGVYVPMLAYNILKAVDNGTYTGPELYGIGVGNGCIGSEIGVCASYTYSVCSGIYYSYQYQLSLAFNSLEIKTLIDKTCDWSKCLLPGSNTSVLGKLCLKLLDYASYEIGDINIYNVYGQCVQNECDGPNPRQRKTSRVGKYSITQMYQLYNKYDTLQTLMDRNIVAKSMTANRKEHRHLNNEYISPYHQIEENLRHLNAYHSKSHYMNNHRNTDNYQYYPDYFHIYHEVYGPDYTPTHPVSRDISTIESLMTSSYEDSSNDMNRETMNQRSLLLTSEDSLDETERLLVNTILQHIHTDTPIISTTATTGSSSSASIGTRRDMRQLMTSLEGYLQYSRTKKEFEVQYSINTNDDFFINDYKKYYDFGPASCGDSYRATTYLMSKAVQQAIHVKPISYCWSTCNQALGFDYTESSPNLPRDIYPYLLSKIRILIFNGDWDACVPYTDNQAWTSNMGYDIIKPWHPWVYTDEDASTQIGGYSIKYNVSHLGTGSFEFRTVRGAGHMIPEQAPLQALYILGHLISKNFDTDDEYLSSEMNLLSSSSCEAVITSTKDTYIHRIYIILSILIPCIIILFGIILYLWRQVYIMKTIQQIQQNQDIPTSITHFNPLNFHESTREKSGNNSNANTVAADNMHMPYVVLKGQEEDHTNDD